MNLSECRSIAVAQWAVRLDRPPFIHATLTALDRPQADDGRSTYAYTTGFSYEQRGWDNGKRMRRC